MSRPRGCDPGARSPRPSGFQGDSTRSDLAGSPNSSAFCGLSLSLPCPSDRGYVSTGRAGAATTRGRVSPRGTRHVAKLLGTAVAWAIAVSSAKRLRVHGAGPSVTAGPDSAVSSAASCSSSGFFGSWRTAAINSVGVIESSCVWPSRSQSSPRRSNTPPAPQALVAGIPRALEIAGAHLVERFVAHLELLGPVALLRLVSAQRRRERTLALAALLRRLGQECGGLRRLPAERLARSGVPDLIGVGIACACACAFSSCRAGSTRCDSTHASSSLRLKSSIRSKR